MAWIQASRRGCRDPSQVVIPARMPGSSARDGKLAAAANRLRSGSAQVWIPHSLRRHPGLDAGIPTRDGERAAKPDDCVLDSALPSLALDSGIPAGMTEARGGMTQDKVAPTGMPQDKGVLAGKPGTTLSRHPGWDAGIQAKSSSRPGCRDPGQGGQARSRRQSSRVWIPRRAQPAPGR
jgi:hypothetical protein